MRDDLHHSLPQTHRWHRVVQAVCAPGLGRDVADELARAVWAGAQEQFTETEWGRAFRAYLTKTQGDLFGTEQVEAGLAQFERTSTTPMAQLAVEVAFAEVHAKRLDAGLESRVTRATLELAAQNSIEGAISWIADQKKDVPVRELRSSLLTALSKCNLAEPPPPKKRTAKLTVTEALDLLLPLKDD